jgi:hypothetical protein
MWPYFHVAPTIWTGTTGRSWKTLGAPYQLLGFYFQTSPHANPYGLYYVSRASIVDETGLALPTIQKVLGQFAESGYAIYDADDQWCWVINMTARQVLKNNAPLASTDNRIRGINAWYAGLPDNPFLGPYWDRYHALVHLAERRDGTRQPEPAAEAVATPPLLAGMEIVIPAPSQDELFERWWMEYPPKKRTGKKAARGEWARIKPRPTPESVAKMIDVLQYHRTCTQWIKDGGRFIPDPERYLKKGRYEDVPAPAGVELSETDAQTSQTLQAWEPPHE